MKDLQLSFLKSGVAHYDAPQNYAYFSTKSILPVSWDNFARDSIQLNSIQKNFGTKKLKKLSITSFFKFHFYYLYIRKQKVISSLNYSKKEALALLTREFPWKDYGVQYNESVWTKFYQNYYLPINKRKAHLSSLILSSEITREDALDQLKKSLHLEKDLRNDLEYIKNKLDLNDKQWEEILNTPKKIIQIMEIMKNYINLKKYFDSIYQR